MPQQALTYATVSVFYLYFNDKGITGNTVITSVLKISNCKYIRCVNNLVVMCMYEYMYVRAHDLVNVPVKADYFASIYSFF